MDTSRSQRISANVNDLINDFANYLAIFSRNPPFQRYGQLEYHQTTIEYRNKASSAIGAINDYSFVNYLYKTLNSWGIGSRGSVLIPFPEFTRELQSKSSLIGSLDGVQINDPKINTRILTDDLWYLFDSLKIVRNDAKLVACSKTLHHILPDLVVPMDRAYTRRFFCWHGPEFQKSQKKFLSLAIENFAKIARFTDPSQYVGTRWNTSQTKVIDNAIVGFLIEHPRDDL